MMKSTQYNTTIVAEQLLYNEFIKYKRLYELINIEFAGSSADKLNIFIDLYSFLMPCYRLVRILNYYSIASAIINYCAHLRNFFRTRYGVSTEIILIYSSNNCINNRRFIPDYNYYYSNRVNSNEIISKAVTTNLKMVATLAPYLPDIYYKEGTAEPTVIIKDLIDKRIFGESPNLVISTSRMMYQLPANTHDTVVIRKKSSKGEDISFSYNMITAIDNFIHEEKNISVNGITVQPASIMALMNLIGIPKLGVKSICDIRSALSIISDIPTGFERDYQTLYSVYSDHIIGKKKTPIEAEEFFSRLSCIDINNQCALYSNMPESNLTNFMTRLNDPNTVKFINNKYFSNAPLDLDRL